MYSSSQYDGPSLFSGGGFMPSQATQSADPSFTPSKNRANQCLIPLTVKQIGDANLSSEDKSNFIVDGVDVNHITLVGLATNKLEKVTDVNSTLDDGTGRIDVHTCNGMYVRVQGQLREFQGKKQVVAFSIRNLVLVRLKQIQE